MADPVTQDPTLAALVEQVREAAERRQPLCIRGSGSKDFYGGPLIGEPLSLGELRGISSYEPTELVVTARAGTPLAELEAALAEKGQWLPFEPPRFGHTPGGGPGGGTVGGMVAAGLAGPARAALGGVRDYVLGATLLNGQAELLSFGGQVMKNVAGYDVSRMLAGSMGVLGVICEVSLKVLPVPPATATLRFDLDQVNALKRVNDWAGQPLPLQASAWWDGALIVRLGGAAAAVESAQRKLGGEPIEPALAARFWADLRDQRDEFFSTARAAVVDGAVLWRLSVAPTAPRIALSGDTLIEWGGGCRWLVSRDSAETVRAAALEARGHATAWWGGERTGEVFGPLSPALLRIHHRLKQAFDPAGIFNRQRLHPAF
ncbi:glycolate oxidase subunit GlcE [Ideonella dechloratans]|nr:glycolate oxidase subunit GlcE [Ideonella dechloratans]UFU09764.1 glycolate oxidase subunit GlcE [Ideonella dechloratans]